MTKSYGRMNLYGVVSYGKEGENRVILDPLSLKKKISFNSQVGNVAVILRLEFIRE